MSVGKSPDPDKARGADAENQNTAKGRTDNTKPPRGMTKEQQADVTGRNPAKPIVGSQAHFDKHGW